MVRIRVQVPVGRRLRPAVKTAGLLFEPLATSMNHNRSKGPIEVFPFRSGASKLSGRVSCGLPGWAEQGVRSSMLWSGPVAGLRASARIQRADSGRCPGLHRSPSSRAPRGRWVYYGSTSSPANLARLCCRSSNVAKRFARKARAEATCRMSMPRWPCASV